MTKEKLGLLDKPDLLGAMFLGKYTVETRAGRVVGIFDSNAEAINASLDDERCMRHSITPPIPADKRADALAGVLRGIEKRKAEGRHIPQATLELAESLKAKA